MMSIDVAENDPLPPHARMAFIDLMEFIVISRTAQSRV